jgi:SAM-dependent methyltransferase
MSHTQFLHVLRQYELGRVLHCFPKRPIDVACRTLEIGAGTGYQARYLSEQGYTVTAIDLESSAYREERVYPIIEYDGRRIPAPDASFQVVFSSNVLEHVRDISPFLDEMRRVMAPNAYAIHILPTPAWRFWTVLSHYAWLLKRFWRFFFPTSSMSTSSKDALFQGPDRSSVRYIVKSLFPQRHGERGNVFTELYFFSTFWWNRQFKACGYEVVDSAALGIFYTGSLAFGDILSISCRQRLAKVLGSACRVYVLRATDASTLDSYTDPQSTSTKP